MWTSSLADADPQSILDPDPRLTAELILSLVLPVYANTVGDLD